eukprot:4404542-Pyramimonas_sp.AAC.1
MEWNGMEKPEGEVHGTKTVTLEMAWLKLAHLGRRRRRKRGGAGGGGRGGSSSSPDSVTSSSTHCPLACENLAHVWARRKRWYSSSLNRRLLSSASTLSSNRCLPRCTRNATSPSP